MSVLSLFILWGFAAVPKVTSQTPPKKLEEPFKVYVFTPPASGPEQEYAERAAKTVRDRIKRRKDWLQVVENKDDAEILVEVYSQGIGQGTSQSTISGPGITNTTPSTTGGELGVRESAMTLEDVANQTADVPKGHHFFETEVTFLSLDSKVILIGTANANRRPSSAADDLAQKLEKRCRDNYAELARRR